MKINCNDINQIKEIYSSSDYVSFIRGSVLYGTNDDNSDIDVAVIVPDDTEFDDIENVFDNEKYDTRIHPAVLFQTDEMKFIDCQFVKSSDFIDMIKEHTPFALEGIATDSDGIDEYRNYFELNLWKLRQSFGAIANNSWSKAHKKMTVEKDLDMKCGVKSLFHSIRLQIFAHEIATKGLLFDFDCCKELWTEMKEDWNNGYDWNKFKEKYKPVYNRAHSDMVEVCPKPKSEYKNNKNR